MQIKGNQLNIRFIKKGLNIVLQEFGGCLVQHLKEIKMHYFNMNFASIEIISLDVTVKQTAQSFFITIMIAWGIPR